MNAIIHTDRYSGKETIVEAIEYFLVEQDLTVVAIISRDELEFAEVDNIPVFCNPLLSEKVLELSLTFEFNIVIDLTQSSIDKKLRDANRFVELGCAVYGPDYKIFPPIHKEIEAPGLIGVMGNINIGKTATVAYLKELSDDHGNVAAVVIDASTKRYSEIVEPAKYLDNENFEELAIDYLAGRVINGYHYTIALSADVPACSAAFAGIGLSGVPFTSLDVDSVINAMDYNPGLIFVVTEKTAVPRVKCDKVISIVDGRADPKELEEYDYFYKLIRTDVVIILTPAGIPQTHAKKLEERLSQLKPNITVLKASETPRLLSTSNFTNSFMISSETEQVSTAQAAFLSKNLSLNIEEILDGSINPNKSTDFLNAKKRKKHKNNFILDLFAERFDKWLYALVDNQIPFTLMTRSLVPSSKKLFAETMSQLLEETFISGQRRLGIISEETEDKDIE